MYEFQWTLPGEVQQAVTLHIASRSSWIGRKTLYLRDRVVYRRGRLEGIEHTFADSLRQHKLLLTWEPLPSSHDWRPVLRCDGMELQEVTDCPLPRIVPRPPLLAWLIGVTCLAMFMMAVMLPHIWNMLYVGRGHSDSRTIVLEVEDESGEISGAPRRSGERVVGVGAEGVSGARTEKPYAISVRPSPTSEPRLVTRKLPPARAGKEYAAQLLVEGGRPPYDWVVNTRKLPTGLSFDRQGGQLSGVVALDAKGVFPLQFRVTDSAYSPYDDLAPWFVPFAATAVCLLGYWNMRRWGVLLYGALLLVQLGAGWVSQYPLSFAPVVWQGLMLLAGAGYFKRMQ
jgi:hypothetical protein